MKTGGIIGGVSWHSTKQLYEYVNAGVAKALGRHNCARMVLINVNLEDILQARNDSAKAAILADAAQRTEKAGASFVALGSNGLHQYADIIQQAIHIPFLHIAEVTADAIQRAGYHTAGLLGVRETMEQGFYKDRLADHGLQVLIPDAEERAFIDNVLLQETGVGVVKEASRQAFYTIAQRLADRGAQCIILGCTEIGMLMQQEDTDLPLFDTTILYAQRITQLCCEEE